MSASPLILPIWQFSDGNGIPYAGGKLYSYQADTTTPQSTYTDQSGNTANPNPLTLDSNGRGTVWLGSNAYKFILEDADGNQVWSKNNISAVNAASITAKMLASDVVGVALAQNATTKALDVQVDGTTIKVNDSNELEVKDGSIGTAKLDSSGTIPVVYKYTRDFGVPSKMIATPQYEWSDPDLLSGTGVPAPGDEPSIIRFSPDGEWLALIAPTDPRIFIYQRSGGIFNKIADLSDPPYSAISSSRALAWSPSGQYLCILSGSNGVGSQGAYLYRRYGNKFVYCQNADAVTWISGKGTGYFCDFSPDGCFLRAECGTSAGHGGGFYRLTIADIDTLDYTGSKTVSTTIADATSDFTDGTTYPPGLSNGSTESDADTTNIASALNAVSSSHNQNVANLASAINSAIDSLASMVSLTKITPGPTGPTIWGPDSSLLLIDGSTTDCFYTRADETWTATTGPDLTSYSGANVAAFSPNGKYVACAIGDQSPYILVYAFDGTNFTLLSNPSDLPAGQVNDISWSLDSKTLALGIETSPYVTIYSVDGTTLTKIADPSTLPGDAIVGLSFSKDKKFLACAIASSPYVNIFETTATLINGAFLTLGDVIDV